MRVTGPVAWSRIGTTAEADEGKTMPTDWKELIARVRSGDSRAAEEIVHKYERVIRLEVRRQLRDPGLRRVFDSMDVCQSVMASFFVRSAAGEHDLEQPEQLVRLLVVMTRHKLAN